MSKGYAKAGEAAKQEPIAVVGVSGIFPGAEHVEAFWQNILQKKDLITDVPKTYWLDEDFFDPDPRKADKVYGKRMGSVPLVGFDYLKFGMPPNVMEHTDAGQLLGLIAAKALFESSFGDKFPAIDREKISVILGYSLCTPLTTELAGTQHKPIWVKALREAGLSEDKVNEVVRLRDSYSTQWQEASFPGCLQNVITGRIANRFDLHGTNCVVDAACASSLAAMHMAIKELHSGDSDMVITGGAQTASTPMMFMCFTKTPAMSPSGECKPFDADSDGMLIGEGVGLIALRRLSDAERDGNQILAVIKGLGTSSDGKGKSIYAPEPEGQARAIRRAYENAGYGPETVELLEAHGTGTKAGDAAEMRSSGRVFSEASPESKNWCALGSVKSQIGHTAGAAGAASFIKVVLALHHKILPPTINVTKPTEQVEWAKSPFYLNAETRPWIHSQDYPRRASLSSFGFGGTNFHVTLEEYRGPAKALRIDPWKSELVPLSAESPAELGQRLAEIDQEIGQGWSLFRIARDARRVFRADQGFRLAMVVADAQDLRVKLGKCRAELQKNGGEQWLPPLGIYYKPGFKPKKVAFLFPGQGSQYLGMGSELAQSFEPFLQVWDQADAERFDGAHRLSQIVFPPPAFDPAEQARQKAKLTETQWAQPSLGLTSAAMLQLLGRFGLRAEMSAGHSFGEVIALFYAGALDLPGLLRVARKRGELMAAASGQKGGMLAVAGSAKTVEERLHSLSSSVVVANYNSPNQVILSGEMGEVLKVKAALEGAGFKTTLLEVSTAFHSPLVSGSKEAFYSFLKEVPFAAPKLPVFSNETVDVYPADGEILRRKLASHLCNPVRFSDEIAAMHEAGANLFVEVGPGATLSKLVEECLNGKDFVAVPLDNKRQDGVTALNHALARLSALGVALDLELLNARRLPEREHAEATPTTVSIDSSTYKKKYPVLAEVMAMPKIQPKEREEMQKTMEEAKIEMKEHTVAESAIGFERAAVGGGAPMRSYMAPPPAFTRPMVSPAPEIAPPVTPVREVEKTLVTQSVAPVAEASPEEVARLSKVLLEVVAEKTGYPSEMLNLEMDMEGDLGIDSIKRVEILSAIRDREPKLPEVQAEKMAEMRTLAQIVEFMRGSAPAAKASPSPIAVVPSSAPMSQSAPLPSTGDAERLTKVLLEVVAEKTGYPSEMLNLEMDMEGDLGIDSIKRVEILSAIRDREPKLPEVQAEKMAEMRTLAQIVEFMKGSAPSAKASPPPVAVVPSPAPMSQSAPLPSTGDAERLTKVLLEVVAEKTGYPSEMLNLEMDMEGDLGIDSIKRVEILSAIRDREPKLPEVQAEKMAEMRTLAQIVEFMKGSAPAAPAEELKVAPQAALPAELPVSDISVGRYEIRLAPCESRSHVDMAKDKKILIADDGSGVGEAMQKIFLDSGFQAVLVESEAEVHSPEDIGGVIYLGGLRPSTSLYSGTKLNKEAFRYAQKFAASIKDAAKQGGGWFITVQDTGGGFGFEGELNLFQATRGGLSGLAKTIQQEWPGVYAKAIDIKSEQVSPESLAMEIIHEIFQGGEQAEIALPLDGRRLAPALDEVPVSHPAKLPIDENSVIVVSGGARGITASCMIELAKKYRPKIVLFGRSEVPEQEEAYLAGAPDLADVKRVLFQKAQAEGEKISPLELEKRARLILNAREVRVTLKALREAGSPVKYFPCDILESRLIRTEGPSWTWKAGNLVRNALAEVRREWGPITGLVHGAGVLADKLIEEKTAAQFDLVFDTKVSGLGELLSVLDRDPLKLLVLFSSVSARFGNAGQADYAMGNEVMNKIAQAEKLRRGKDVCVKSINWGAWESGMVSASLKREFEKRGIRLIPMQAGPAIFVRELEEAGSPVEVVVGSPLQSPEGSKKKDRDRLSVEVGGSTHGFLQDHSIRQVPVVPAVLAMEWFGQLARSFAPELPLRRLKNVRVLKGIELPEFWKAARRFEIRAVQDGGENPKSVKMELRGQDNRLHYACEAEMGSPPIGSEEFPPMNWRGSGKRLDIQNEYEAFFYGPMFKMLQSVEILDERTIASDLLNTRGMKWTGSLGNGSDWTVDSAMVEGGFQSLLWLLRRLQGGVALPAKVGALELLAPISRSETATCLARVKQFDKVRAVSEIFFYDSQGTPIARIRDVESYIMPG